VLSNIGCNIGGVYYNILAYADDLVLFAPSWKALQDLINVINCYAQDMDKICNIDKTVCMIVWSSVLNVGGWLLQQSFHLSINDIDLKYVAQFKYLGHMINNDFIDNDDIKRETRNMFIIRSNILIRRYSKCSVAVKSLPFKAFCMCVYDASIWLHYSITVCNKFRSCITDVWKCFLVTTAATVSP